MEAAHWVGVLDAVGVATDEVRVLCLGRESDELGLVGVSSEAVPVQPLEGGFKAPDSRDGGSVGGGRDGIDGAVVDVHDEIPVDPALGGA